MFFVSSLPSSLLSFFQLSLSVDSGTNVLIETSISFLISFSFSFTSFFVMPLAAYSGVLLRPAEIRCVLTTLIAAGDKLFTLQYKVTRRIKEVLESESFIGTLQLVC